VVYRGLPGGAPWNSAQFCRRDGDQLSELASRNDAFYLVITEA
jgi:hypothetical protein